MITAKIRLTLDFMYKFNGACAALSLLILFGLVLVQMVIRWSGNNIPGLTTYAGYVMAALSFFGLSYALHSGAHIKVGLLLSQLGRHRKLADIVSAAVSSVLAVIFGCYALKTAYVSLAIGEISQAQDATPIWIAQIPMVIGALAFSIAALDGFFKALIGDADIDAAGHAATDKR